MYLSRVQLCNSEVVHDLYELSRSLEHPRNFLVSYAHEPQSIQESRADKVVTMHLRASNFMPHRCDCSVMRCRRDGTMYSRGLIQATNARQCDFPLQKKGAYLAEITYSPAGLQATLLTGARCPVIAPTSDHSSSAGFSASFSVSWHLHRRQPPFQPQAIASAPLRAQRPPTKPPSRCPPTSPKRCLLIQSVVSSVDDVRTVDGDQRMSDESVDVERRVGSSSGVRCGRHDKDVTLASCPTRSASKVTENSWDLICRV